MLIGQASPLQAAQFRRTQGIELAVLADEHRRSYTAAGAKTAVAQELLGPRVVAKGALATLRTRQRQTRSIGDPAQLGGVLVIKPTGEVAWAHMSEDAGDNASPDEILAAVSAL